MKTRPLPGAAAVALQRPRRVPPALEVVPRRGLDLLPPGDGLGRGYLRQPLQVEKGDLLRRPFEDRLNEPVGRRLRRVESWVFLVARRLESPPFVVEGANDFARQLSRLDVAGGRFVRGQDLGQRLDGPSQSLHVSGTAHDVAPCLRASSRSSSRTRSVTSTESRNRSPRLRTARAVRSRTRSSCESSSAASASAARPMLLAMRPKAPAMNCPRRSATSWRKAGSASLRCTVRGLTPDCSAAAPVPTPVARAKASDRFFSDATKRDILRHLRLGRRCDPSSAPRKGPPTGGSSAIRRARTARGPTMEYSVQSIT